MSFFHILFSVCFGTSVFPELKKQTLGRAIWHLCLLAFLCTIVIGIATYFIYCREVESVAHRFFEQTGDILVSPEGIVLEKDPDQSRSYLLNHSYRFDYIAKESDLTMVKPGEWKENRGILCFPSLAAFWVRNPKANTFCLFYLPVQLFRTSVTESPEKQKDAAEQLKKDYSRLYSASEMQKKLKEILGEQSSIKATQSPALKQTFKSMVMKLDEDLTVSVVCTGSVMLAITLFSTSETYLLLFTIILVTIFLCFRNKYESNPLTKTQLAVITIYTAFPPLIIYTVFSIVSLPFSWLSAEHLYFAAFFIYQIFVLRTVYNDGRVPELPEK